MVRRRCKEHGLVFRAVARRNRVGANCSTNLGEKDMDDDVLKRAKEARASLKKQLENSNYFSLTHYCVGFEDKNNLYQLNHSCFGDLRYDSTLRGKDVCFLVTHLPTAKNKRWRIPLQINNKEEEEKYLHWLINDSPWAPVIVTEEPSVLREEGMILETDFPPQLVISACMSFRYLSLCPWVITFWNKFVNAGVDPRFAFFLSQGARTEEKGGTYGMMMRSANEHEALNVNRMLPSSVVNFLEGKPINVGKKNFRDNTNFEGIFRMWGKEKNNQPTKDFHLSGADAVTRQDAWGYQFISYVFKEENMLEDAKVWFESFTSKEK